MEMSLGIRTFLVLYTPFIIVFFLAVLLFTRAPRTVALPALLAGVLVAVVNLLFDLAAYYAHWWHYNLNGLTFHLPIPFYLTPMFTYGASAFVLIWRFWGRRTHWIGLALLFGMPALGILRDIYGALLAPTYLIWDNQPLAAVATIVMWLLMFYGGYWVFRRLAPARVEEPKPQSANVS